MRKRVVAFAPGRCFISPTGTKLQKEPAELFLARGRLRTPESGIFCRLHCGSGCEFLIHERVDCPTVLRLQRISVQSGENVEIDLFDISGIEILFQVAKKHRKSLLGFAVLTPGGGQLFGYGEVVRIFKMPVFQNFSFRIFQILFGDC